MRLNMIRPWQVILLCALFYLVGCGPEGGTPTPVPVVTTVPNPNVTAVPAENGTAVPATIPFLDGHFTGTVAITEPVALGAFDLAINLSNAGSTLSGTVDITQTMAFSKATSLKGTITSTSSTTPTFRLTAEPFTESMSGQPVKRSFVLTGEVERDGSALRGQYVETIEGYTPEPLNVRGTFLLVRSDRNPAAGTASP
jgi:hypothetical protein